MQVRRHSSVTPWPAGSVREALLVVAAVLAGCVLVWGGFNVAFLLSESQKDVWVALGLGVAVSVAAAASAAWAVDRLSRRAAAALAATTALTLLAFGLMFWAISQSF